MLWLLDGDNLCNRSLIVKRRETATDTERQLF